MKRFAFLLFLALMPGIFIFSQSRQVKPLKDAGDRLIRDSQGNRINYYEPADILLVNHKAPRENGQGSTEATLAVPVCRPQWFQGVMGACIGVNSMISKDIDHDGKTEIICSAGYGFGSSLYWYVLRYDPYTGEYPQVWISTPVNDSYYGNTYSCIRAFDTDNDNIYEIYVGHAEGNVEVYSGNGMDLIRSFMTNGTVVNDILFDDADNDGEKELVVCSDEETFLFSADGQTLKNTLNYGGSAVAIGNVDADPDNEIVYSSGTIIDVTGNTPVLEWNIYSTTEDFPNLGLTDSDNDGMKEVVIAKGWYVIEVYDADIKALKGTIESELDIDALLIADVSNDGQEEILYGDGQWGNIYCYKASSLALMWQIYNPEHGVTEINVADMDNDGSLEVMWGAGCSSTGSDYIYIHNITDLAKEYQSKDINGPFYDVETGDVDGDGKDEIMTISYSSESDYESGILSIFNGTTHALIWQCDGYFFPNAWEGIYAMELANVSGDSRPEIIVATDVLYDGAIYVVDGLSHEIISSHNYGYNGPGGFAVIAVSDVDNDGTQEFVTANTGNLYVINSSDYSIEWTSPSFTGTGIKSVMAGNLDSDSNPEIVVCFGGIMVYDGITHSQWSPQGNNYTNIDLSDYDGDGITEIIASTGDGKIVMIDFATGFVMPICEFGTETIDGVRAIDLNGTGQEEFVFTRNGMIYFANASGDYVTTDNFGTGAGLYDALKIGDVNNDQVKEIYAGTKYQVVAVSQECSSCLGFKVSASGTKASCLPGNDGTAAATVTAGTGPYTYLWSNGKTQQNITSLAPGNYWVVVTDSKGCTAQDTVNVGQSEISIYVTGKDVGCGGTQDGSASVTILSGTPPYTYNWSNGESQAEITALSPGTYSCNVTDARGCSELRDITIRKDTVVVDLNVQSPECYGTGGQGYVIVLSGTPPFTFHWGNVSGSNYMDDLPAGTFILTVIDSLNCDAHQQYTITEPPPMILTTSYIPDDTTTTAPDGQATVSVTGGTPPYFYYWNDPYYQTSATAISLSNGQYMVVVRDLNGCEQYAGVELYPLPVVSLISDQGISVFPNPANQILKVHAGFDHPVSGSIKLVDLFGQEKESRSFSEISTGDFVFSVSDYAPSVYFVMVQTDEFTKIRKFVIRRP